MSPAKSQATLVVGGHRVMRAGGRTTIGLLDHMGFGNLGDAAIQESVIANIKKRLPNAHLVGFSAVPSDTITRHGIPCHSIRRSHDGNHAGAPPSLQSRLKVALKGRPLFYAWAKPVADVAREALFWIRSYRVLRKLDLLIISGGGQLGDLWFGPWSHPYTIFKFSVLTKLARKRLYFLNVGAGPLQHPLSRFFTRWAVRLADYLSFRDPDSRELVRSIGVKTDAQVYPDPAYALELDAYLTRPPSGASTSLVGLNPMGFADPRVWPRKDESTYQAYLDKTVRFSEWLLAQGYKVTIFTTDPATDRYATADLSARLRAKGWSPQHVSQGFTDPHQSLTDVLQVMSECDFIVTSKFHGILFSHLLRKPVISLSYHRKMDAAMKALGQGRFCAAIEHFEVDWLIETFRSLVSERERIQSRCGTAVEAYAAKLSQQFDGLFLADRSREVTRIGS